MRYLLIDRILDFERDRRVVATKNVTLESDVLEHHVRGFPLFPGALTLESMAQAGAYLVMRSLHETSGELHGAALGAVEQAHFRRPVLPGDQLRITVEITDRRPHAVQVAARADVDGRNAARSRLLLVHRTIDAVANRVTAEFVLELFQTLERRETYL